MGGRRHLPLRPARSRDEVFSIDTPPPTVSRLAARRPRVLLHPHRHRSPATSACAGARSSTRWAGTTTACPPSGGSQNYYGVRCDPSLPYDPDFEPPDKPGQGARRSRSSPPQLHRAVRAADREDEKAFEELWRRLGLSVDWTLHLHDDRRRRRSRVSQRAFLRNLARGEAYSAEAPTLWDVDFRTAVAQAELEDRERPGAYHRARLPRHRRTATDRRSRRPGPSCSPACVALVAHPDDERYQPLFGTTVQHAAVRRRGAGPRAPRWPSPTRAPASR